MGVDSQIYIFEWEGGDAKEQGIDMTEKLRICAPSYTPVTLLFKIYVLLHQLWCVLLCYDNIMLLSEFC